MMKTARQSGWSMTGATNFITLHDDYGNYLEVFIEYDGNLALVDCNNTGITLLDLPLSVLRLISLWLEIKFVALALKEGGKHV